MQPHLVQDLPRRRQLAGAAIDQHQIGPGVALAARVFLQGAAEAAFEDLAHHGEVIPAAERQSIGLLGVPDPVLPVVLLQEARRPGDDHHAIGVRAHDVAVVVDLDALGRVGQVEDACHALQQLRLRRALGHAALDRLTRIGGGVLDGGALLAALGAVDLDLAPRLERERIGQHRGLARVVADQHQRRRWQVVIELGEEGAEHLFGRLLGAGVGQEIGPVAVVAPAAEEEDLHAGLPGHLVQRDHIGIADAIEVDAVAALHMRQAPDAVAEARRALEFELLRRRLHLGRETPLDARRAAGEILLRLPHQRGVVVLADPLHAGRGAALDLEQQAGAGPAVEDGVAAGPQQEDALQRGQGLVDRPGGGEGAPVAGTLAAFAAMLGNLREGVVLGQDQPGIGFVVAENDVVARPEALDEVRFQQQRLGLGRCRDDLKAPRLMHHAAQALGQLG